jgi:adenosine/AMP kinase
MDLQSLKIELPANTQIILAQSHFIKTHLSGPILRLLKEIAEMSLERKE